jgi:hypothetical protein
MRISLEVLGNRVALVQTGAMRCPTVMIALLLCSCGPSEAERMQALADDTAIKCQEFRTWDESIDNMNSAKKPGRPRIITHNADEYCRLVPVIQQAADRERSKQN